MIETVYIEKSVCDHPRTLSILSKLSAQVRIIECDHYAEIFNRKGQNFRQQKANPALILAKKQHKKVLPTPEGFGIGGEQNYYFSHMLNCLYDCRYCFLQGMYPSAHFVLFVNYEDIMQDIQSTMAQNQDDSCYFFSGYDCDSLAMEHLTGFIDSFLPFFAENPQAILELRTKSTNIRALLKHQPIKNCVVAFSFTPEVISKAVEYKVPQVQKRIAAIESLMNAGWQVGLRFDPLIYADNFTQLYSDLIQRLFEVIQPNLLHSISVGPMRFPEKMYQRIAKLYPHDKLLAHPLEKRGKIVSYSKEIEQTMKADVLRQLEQFVPKTQIFECMA